MDLLDQLVKESEQKSTEIEQTLKAHEGQTTKWFKNDSAYYILSQSTKKDGYQLTFFIKDEPISDKIRDNYNDADFIQELVINGCELEAVI